MKPPRKKAAVPHGYMPFPVQLTGTGKNPGKPSTNVLVVSISARKRFPSVFLVSMFPLLFSWSVLIGAVAIVTVFVVTGRKLVPRIRGVVTDEGEVRISAPGDMCLLYNMVGVCERMRIYQHLILSNRRLIFH